MLAREVTTLVHGADQVARAEHASSAAVRRGHRDARRSTTCWRCSRTCRRRSFAGDGAWRRGAWGWSICGARAAGAVEERGAAARAVGRRVREQPARVGSAGAGDAGSGDRRPGVRAAEGAEAEPPRQEIVPHQERSSNVSLDRRPPLSRWPPSSPRWRSRGRSVSFVSTTTGTSPARPARRSAIGSVPLVPPITPSAQHWSPLMAGVRLSQRVGGGMAERCADSQFHHRDDDRPALLVFGRLTTRLHVSAGAAAAGVGVLGLHHLNAIT